MDLPTIECARALRDGGIDAMAALDDALANALATIPETAHRDLKQAVGRVMAAIMGEVINPAVVAFPALEPNEEAWREAIRQRVSARAAKLPPSA